MRRKPKYVYLLSTESYGHSGFIKVGITCDYVGRIRQVSNTTPFYISPLIVVEVDNPSDVEASVLEKFKQYRIKGEWFYIKPSDGLDPSMCSFREFMDDFTDQSKLLERKMKRYLKSRPGARVVDALL